MRGINTGVFKSHSTCSVSSSYARFSSLSLSDALKGGSWFSKNTWEMFYNKPIMISEEKILNINALKREWALGSTFTLP